MSPYTFKNDWSDAIDENHDGGGGRPMTTGMTLQITPYPALYRYDGAGGSGQYVISRNGYFLFKFSPLIRYNDQQQFDPNGPPR